MSSSTTQSTPADLERLLRDVAAVSNLTTTQVVAALQASLTLVGTSNQIIIDPIATPGSAIFKLADRTKVPAVEVQSVRRKNSITATLRVNGYLDDSYLGGAALGDGQFTTPSATTSTPEQFSISFVVPASPNAASNVLGDLTFATPLVGEAFSGDGVIIDTTNGAVLAGGIGSITSAGCILSRQTYTTLVAGRSYVFKGRISQISSAA